MSTIPLPPIPAAVSTAAASTEGIPLSNEERRAILDDVRIYIRDGELWQSNEKAQEIITPKNCRGMAESDGLTNAMWLMNGMREMEYSIYLMDEARAIAKGAQRDATTLLVLLAKVEEIRGNAVPAYMRTAPFIGIDFEDIMAGLRNKQYACSSCEVEYVYETQAEQCCTLPDIVTCLPDCAFPDTCGAAASCAPDDTDVAEHL